MNTKLHALWYILGRPLTLVVSAGQVSDYVGARALLSGLPDVVWLLGVRGLSDVSACRITLGVCAAEDFVARTFGSGSSKPLWSESMDAPCARCFSTSVPTALDA